MAREHIDYVYIYIYIYTSVMEAYELLNTQKFNVVLFFVEVHRHCSQEKF